LNPETNSLSPSAKSKGERFVSATTEIIQNPNITIKIVLFKKNPLKKFFSNLKDLEVIQGKKIKVNMTIS
jgi:hypothetical protein